jgi:hypothetical protein
MRGAVPPTASLRHDEEAVIQPMTRKIVFDTEQYSATHERYVVLTIGDADALL